MSCVDCYALPEMESILDYGPFKIVSVVFAPRLGILYPLPAANAIIAVSLFSRTWSAIEWSVTVAEFCPAPSVTRPSVPLNV
jgi:hypothetical protein